MVHDVVSGLKVVDALDLPDAYREALRPDEMLTDSEGRAFRLPRYFLEVGSWQMAKETMLAPDFGLYEFINTDLHEARVLRSFPRYVPLAILHLAAHLSVLRKHVGTFVHIAANGGYRSPSHELSSPASTNLSSNRSSSVSSNTSPNRSPNTASYMSTHCWGTAANIYRIGDDYLDDEETVRRYAEIVMGILPGAWIRPYGVEVGSTIDHLHVDLGRYALAPWDVGTGREGKGRDE